MKRTHVLAVLCGLALLGCGKFFPEEAEIPNTFEMPPGTEIVVKPTQSLSLENLEAGSEFAGVLAESLYYVRESIDEQGEIFETKTLVAPDGMPVHGTVVSEPGAGEAEARLGLKLTAVTFHGGMSFDIATEPVFDLGPETEKITFKLSEPADVAMVIDLRKEQGEKERS